MSENDAGRTRVRCRRAFLIAGPVAALLILSAGSLAHAAESDSAAPPSVSVSWTGPDGQPTGRGPAVVPTTTTTPISSVAADSPGDPSSSLQQTLSVSIEPGPLTVSPGSESAVLSRSHGQDSYRGDLTPVTVVDARGSLVGWDATVSLQSVAGLSTSQLANARLCVDPDAVTTVAGRSSEVRSATRSCGRVGEPLSVFFAPQNGGGGTFSDTASLSLVLPATSSAGQVTASLAVAVH